MLKKIDKVTTHVVLFILRVLGAFGACWGTFSSVDVTRKQIFGMDDDSSLMDNPIYAKVALGASISAACVSSYVLLREKLFTTGDAPPTAKELNSLGCEEIKITVPFHKGTKSKKNAAQKSQVVGDIENQISEVDDSYISDTEVEVYCKRKNY